MACYGCSWIYGCFHGVLRYRTGNNYRETARSSNVVLCKIPELTMEVLTWEQPWILQQRSANHPAIWIKISWAFRWFHRQDQDAMIWMTLGPLADIAQKRQMYGKYMADPTKNCPPKNCNHYRPFIQSDISNTCNSAIVLAHAFIVVSTWIVVWKDSYNI